MRPDIGHELVYTALKELAIIYFKGWDPDDYSYDSYREDKKARRLVRAEKAGRTVFVRLTRIGIGGADEKTNDDAFRKQSVSTF